MRRIAAVLAAALYSTTAFAQTTTLFGLPPATTLYPNDAIGVDQSAALPGRGATKKATPAQIVGAGIVPLFGTAPGTVADGSVSPAETARAIAREASNAAAAQAAQTTANLALPAIAVGANNGAAALDGTGHLPASQAPAGAVLDGGAAAAAARALAAAALPAASAGPLATLPGVTPSAAAIAALGFTPYNAANPAGFVGPTGAAAAAPVQSVAGLAGAPTAAQVAAALGGTSAGTLATGNDARIVGAAQQTALTAEASTARANEALAQTQAHMADGSITPSFAGIRFSDALGARVSFYGNLGAPGSYGLNLLPGEFGIASGGNVTFRNSSGSPTSGTPFLISTPTGTTIPGAMSASSFAGSGSALTVTPTNATVAVSEADNAAVRVVMQSVGFVGDGVTDNASALTALASNPAYANKTVTLVPLHPGADVFVFATAPALPPQWTIDGLEGQVRGLRFGHSWNSAMAFAAGRVWNSNLPAVGDAITIGGVCSFPQPSGYYGHAGAITGGAVVSFVASASGTHAGTTADPYQVTIGSTMQAFAANLLAFLQGSSDPNITQATYKTGAWNANQMTDNTARWQLEVTYKTASTTGNSFGLGIQATGNGSMLGTGGWFVSGPGQLAGSVQNINQTAGVSCGVLQGGFAPPQGTTIVLGNSSGPVTLSAGAGGGLRNIYVVAGNVPSLPVVGMNVLTQIATMYSGAGVGVSMGKDATLANVGVVGFRTGINSHSDRPKIDHVIFDDWNGIDIANDYDLGVIDSPDANAFWSGEYGYNGIDVSYRPGNFIVDRDGGSGITIIRPFCYGCGVKYSFHGDAGVIVNAGGDGPIYNSASPIVNNPAVLDYVVTNPGTGYVSPVVTDAPNNGETISVVNDTTSTGIYSVDALTSGNWTNYGPATALFPPAPLASPTVTVTDSYSGASTTVGTAQGATSATLVLASGANVAQRANVSGSCIASGSTVSTITGSTVTLSKPTSSPCAAGTAISVTGGTGAAVTAYLRRSECIKTFGLVSNLTLTGANCQIQDMTLDLKGQTSIMTFSGVNDGGVTFQDARIGSGMKVNWAGGAIGGGWQGPGSQVTVGAGAQLTMSNVLMGCSSSGAPLSLDPTTALTASIVGVLNDGGACQRDPVMNASTDQAFTIPAAGANQATAQQLASSINLITSGTGGVRMNFLARPQTVANSTGAPITLYAPNGALMNNGAAGVGVAITAGSTLRASCTSPTTCFSY